MTQKYVNELAFKIMGCAIEVHKQRGRGLLKSVYETCMIEEMTEMGLKVKSQLFVPKTYKGKELRNQLKLDLWVNDLINS